MAAARRVVVDVQRLIVRLVVGRPGGSLALEHVGGAHAGLALASATHTQHLRNLSFGQRVGCRGGGLGHAQRQLDVLPPLAAAPDVPHAVQRRLLRVRGDQARVVLAHPVHVQVPYAAHIRLKCVDDPSPALAVLIAIGVVVEVLLRPDGLVVRSPTGGRAHLLEREAIEESLRTARACQVEHRRCRRGGAGRRGACLRLGRGGGGGGRERARRLRVGRGRGGRGTAEGGGGGRAGRRRRGSHRRRGGADGRGGRGGCRGRGCGAGSRGDGRVCAACGRLCGRRRSERRR
mmetsp:Transcript_76946/g.198157  ORF Transcript_76946/g.198157 Transcript_76946/m.198157 type:complete len:290 (-) Transcript_76946:597-1466(-)